MAEEYKGLNLNTKENEEEKHDFSITLGEPLKEGEEVAKRADILPALDEVIDPELYMSVLDLGLIYDINIAKDGTTTILMTVTTIGCPYADEMPELVASRVAQVKGVGEVTVQLVWEPEWNMEMLSDKAKLEFDFV